MSCGNRITDVTRAYLHPTMISSYHTVTSDLSDADVDDQTTLTLLRSLLPYGYSYKASCVRPG